MLHSRPCCLSILYIYNSLYPLIPNSQSIMPSPHPPPWQSQICSLCLRVCVCFISFFFFKCHANWCHLNIPLPYTRQTVVTLPYGNHRPVPPTPWAPGGQCRSPADLCDSRPQHPASVHQNTICNLISFECVTSSYCLLVLIDIPRSGTLSVEESLHFAPSI